MKILLTLIFLVASIIKLEAQDFSRLTNHYLFDDCQEATDFANKEMQKHKVDSVYVVKIFRQKVFDSSKNGAKEDSILLNLYRLQYYDAAIWSAEDSCYMEAIKKYFMNRDETEILAIMKKAL